MREEGGNQSHHLRLRASRTPASLTRPRTRALVSLLHPPHHHSRPTVLGLFFYLAVKLQQREQIKEVALHGIKRQRLLGSPSPCASSL